jgi:hypothetical protein
MSIALVQPSLLLNSYAFTDLFGGCGMFMDTTWNCPRNTTAKHIVNWILVAVDQTPDKNLHHVVLNFHGREEGPSKKIGERESMVILGEATPESGFGTSHFKEATHYALDLTNVGLFSALKGKNIGTLWFHSCALAKDLKGKYFCQRLAEVSGCKVVAAEETQEEWWASINVIFMPRGSIDDYEGKVWIWVPKGNQVTIGGFSPNGGNWT